MSWRTLYRIGRRPVYTGLFLLVFAIIISVIALLPNFALLVKIVFAEVVLSTKVLTVLALYGSLQASFTVVTLFIVLLFAFLAALNITLLTYYIRRRRRGGAKGKVTSVATFGGIISGALGLGCAACGSIVLSVVATTLGGVGFLALLPLHGTEFSFLGLGLLLYSTYIILRHINDPLSCEQK